MTEISSHAIVILIAVGLVGAFLAILRMIHARRLASARGAIRRLEGRAQTELLKAESAERPFLEEEDLELRPSLYGIPYLAWILASLLVPVIFGILFFENLLPPYPLPEVGARAWFAYRSPADFQFDGISYSRHQLLVGSGSVVTREDRNLIREAVARRGQVIGLRVWGSLVLLSVFILILLYYISLLYPSGVEKNKNLLLIFLTIVIVLVCAKLSLFYGFFSPFLIPIPWAGMTITIFINRRVVPLTILATLIFVSVVSDFNFTLFVVLLAGGLVSGSWVKGVTKRSGVIAASFLVSLVMGMVYVGHSMLVAPLEPLWSAELVASLGNGIVSGLLALILLPVLELLFDFASPFRLMEFLDLNTPLMKEFFFKAPGTYQHSMAVANIAELVANEVGANALLVRVGAYYHDIGKIFNPEYFIENQTGGANPHDALGPIASAAVVRSHVILGVRLGRQIGLPGPIAAFIPEHHGTSTIDYFYYKSRSLDSGLKSERIFKYPGPRPKNRETAILMIVDSVEAACRVVKGRDEDTIRDMVIRIAQRKLEQGELDRSGLTIGEFKQIVQLLTRILKSGSHERIAYPDDESEPGREQPAVGRPRPAPSRLGDSTRKP